MLNSDNINITGESFDYGPWRFTPYWDPEFTAAYFDHYGLYAFGRQPEAIHWDLAQLAGCLSLVADAPALSDMLAGWSDRFEQALTEAMLRRLGVAPGKEDREIAAALIKALATPSADDRPNLLRLARRPRSGRRSFIRRRFSASSRGCSSGRAPVRSHPYWSDAEPCSMHIEEVEAIWTAIAERDDWQLLTTRLSRPSYGRRDGAGCTGKLERTERTSSERTPAVAQR